MHRAHLRTLVFATIGLGLPSFAIAAVFQGPTQSPPTGNAPGVIWNMKDNPTQVQAGAVINVPGVRTDAGTQDVYFSNTRKLHVDNSASSTYQMGNWGGSGGTLRAFSLYNQGDLFVYPLASGTGQPGERGRVQASEFCFNPGTDPTDCLTAWPSSGNFVSKTGDTMSGALTITAPGTSLTTNGGTTGGFFNGSTYGAYGVGGQYGGVFTSTGNYGVYGVSTNALGIAGNFVGGAKGVRGETNTVNGVGVDAYAPNGYGIWAAGQTAGVFQGSTVGLTAHVTGANSSAIIGRGNGAASQAGGMFVNGGLLAPQAPMYTYLATGTTAVFAVSPNIAGNFRGGLWGVYGTATNATGAGIRGSAGTSAVGVFGSALPGKIAVLAESETPFQGTPLVSRLGAIGADIDGNQIGLNVHGGSIGIDIDAVGGTALRATSTNQAAWFDNNTNGVRSRATTGAGIMGIAAGNGPASVGVYGEAEQAVTPAGRFNNPSAGTDVKLGVAGYGVDSYGAIRVRSGAGATLIDLRTNGEIHTNANTSGFYFSDRANLPREWAWYSNSGNAYLWNNNFGNYLTINEATGASYNRKNLSTWDTTSDIRLKNVLGDYSKGLEEISKLNTIRFTYKDLPELGLSSKMTHQGVIAQEVEKVFPEAVTTDAKGYKSVNIDPIFWGSVNSIKELKKENDELKAKVESLEQRLERLEAQMK